MMRVGLENEGKLKTKLRALREAVVAQPAASGSVGDAGATPR
jgi:hypothetical protein